MEAKGKNGICTQCPKCGRTGGCGRRVIVAEVECSGSVRPTGRASGMILDKPKMCRCGMGQCKILTSTRVHSRGRRFYCCPQSSGATNHGCGMFEWVSEEGGSSANNSCSSTAEDNTITPPHNTKDSSSLYTRGYLDGAIRASEQQTNALKSLLDALTQLDVNPK